ncbi:uncharacterized protein LOC118482589 [Helianthus annuus]|uniref:uncharacterized protein LOC118482589 n=1 Tax=Helianthus annuus TaxID=4232 RepID=UPI00165311D1|nr:uncharacterized protein LOC118482589 [Helianthus annuus]
MAAVDGLQFCDPPDTFIKSKFARIREFLKKWRDEFLIKERESESLAISELEKLEEEMELRDLSEEEEWVMSENRKIIQEIDDRKRADTKQRARIRWAVDGDENSKFFHALVNNRKASNNNHGLSIDGEWCTKPVKIKKEIFSFFRDKFKEKIRNEVFECGEDRAPGPDGFNFKFIKHFWEIFKDDFFRIFAWFHNHGVINDGCVASFIALIAKISDPVSLNNYRPINLVGVICKWDENGGGGRRVLGREEEEKREEEEGVGENDI